MFPPSRSYNRIRACLKAVETWCKEEFVLIAIHFEEMSDCKMLYQQLKEHVDKYASFGLKGTVTAEGEDTIVVDYEQEDIDFYDSFHPLIVSLLTDFIIDEKEDKWLLEIIETMFYFTDEDEKQQILTIAQSIIEGEHPDLPLNRRFFDRRRFIYDAFSEYIDEGATFYFEAFLTFRLREYSEWLIDCVEMAIDEYMLEQEYQNMIETYRQYIRTYPPKYPLIHVVCDGRYTFYDEHFREMTKDELLFHLDEAMLFEKGLNDELTVLSPLVSMRPETVYVFSDDEDDGVIASIQAIFQERMKLFPLHEKKEQKRLDR